MKLQRTGGVASLANAVLVAIFLVIILVVFPRLGLTGPGDWMDVAKGAQAFAASPLTFFSLDIEYILMGIAFLLIMLALRERMQADAPILTQVALMVAPIACAFWLAAGLFAHTMHAVITGAGDASASRAAMSVYFGLSASGDHASGWALLLIGLAALRTAKLPRVLAYLIVLVGVVFILAFLSLPLGMVGLVLLIIMSVWLGVVLLRAKT